MRREAVVAGWPRGPRLCSQPHAGCTEMARSFQKWLLIWGLGMVEVWCGDPEHPRIPMKWQHLLPKCHKCRG